MKDIYQNITILKDNVSYEYTPAMKLLYEAVKRTNRSKIAKSNVLDTDILEHSKKFENTEQFAYLERYRPTLLPR